MTNLIGQYLGRYHILEQLGEGGMATVYKAYDTRLETDVAVKVIRTDTLAPSVLSRTLKRFEREAKALARLTHANIVKVSDYGEYEGHPFLVMPYLPGGNLKERLKKGVLPWAEAVYILIPIARALEYAHQQGVIHRDVKPSNILITDSGDPMLTDFGVAKVVEEEATVDLTGTAMAVGTPEYMAPEQATSKSIDHRVDIYALGIVFYEMVTGRKPYIADTPLAVLFKQASEPLPRPRQFASTLPDKVEQAILKALAKKPEDRYQTMDEFAVALERCLADATVDQRQTRIMQAAANPGRDAKVTAQKEKAQKHKVSPLIVARPPSVTSFEVSLKSKFGTIMGGTKSVKWIIAIGGFLVLAVVLLLVAALLPILTSNSGKGLVSFSSQTVTFTQQPTMMITPAKIQPNTLTLLPTPSIFYGFSNITPTSTSLLAPSPISTSINAWMLILNRTLIGHSVGVQSLAFSPDGKFLASGSTDQTIVLFNSTNGNRALYIDKIDNPISCIVFSPDGKILASGTTKGTIILWDTFTGRRIRTLDGQIGNIDNIIFAHDGLTLFSGSDDATVNQWEVSTGQLDHTLSSDSAIINIAITSDDKFLFVADKSGVVTQWDLSNNKKYHIFQTEVGTEINGFNLSPDEIYLAYSSRSESSVVFQNISTNDLTYAPMGPNSGVQSFIFSSDGTLAAVTADQTIILWLMGNYPQINYYYHKQIEGISFSPNGKLFAISFLDGSIDLWVKE